MVFMVSHGGLWKENDQAGWARELFRLVRNLDNELSEKAQGSSEVMRRSASRVNLKCFNSQQKQALYLVVEKFDWIYFAYDGNIY